MIIKKLRWCLNAVQDKSKPIVCMVDEDCYWYNGIDINPIDNKPGWTQVILKFEKIEAESEWDDVEWLPEHSVKQALSDIDKLLADKKIDDADQITDDRNRYLWSLGDADVAFGMKFFKLKEAQDNGR